MSLEVDRQGELWVGTFNNGLDRFDPTTGKFKHYLHDENDAEQLVKKRCHVRLRR